jgi:DNA-binding CsgD family transcriptional regulator
VVIPGMPDKLKHGRESFQIRAWNDAYELLCLADHESPLEVADLERLATAAYLIGRETEFQKFLDRAHRAHLEAGERLRAARCAFWLCLSFHLRGETAQASGWLARGQRLVQEDDCVERGYLLMLVFEQHLAAGGAEAAHDVAAQAAGLGDRFGDADLAACARHLQGRALIRQGNVQAGLALLDEAMLAAMTDELSPIMTGLIYCSVIEVCQDVYSFSRAWEWTAAMARWCEQQSQMVTFNATCLVRRAQVLQVSGAWPDAMAETRRAYDLFARRGDRMPPASVFYQQAELHRLRGEYKAAEEAYRNAGRAGAEPQPGLALLRMAQGRSAAACAAIRRVLGVAATSLRRAKMLPAYIEIMLAMEDLQAARTACLELEEIAAKSDTEVLTAMAGHARGAVELADGNAQAAIGFLRRASEVWTGVGAPYEVARVRALIGMACRALGDDEAGAVELAAARAEFERLEARPDIARLDYPAKRTTARHKLTPREIQVLRLIATGKTNKAIGAELHLSERTIDRHVSNILTKLGVPSRTAAIACAYDHKLF